MEYHEYANLFPLLEGKAFDEFCADIKRDGLKIPIVTYQGAILDGRNRYRACIQVGAQLKFTEYTGNDPVGEVVSMNLQRYQYSESQRAMIAAGIANMKLGDNQYKQGAPIGAPTSQPEAATMLNVSRRAVQRASHVIHEGTPELIQSVQNGDIAVSLAAKIAELPKEEQNEVLSSGSNAQVRSAAANSIKKQKKEKAKESVVIVDKPSFTANNGDLWKCGNHLVMCGDCYNQDDMSRLVGNRKVDALITDPPYGIGYKPDWHKWDGSASDYKKITGDEDEFDPSEFINYPTVVLFGANYFSNKLPIGGWICWDKRLDEVKDAMVGSPFELAWFRSSNTKKNSIMIRVLHGGVVNADSKKGNNEKRLHPTQKPVIVMERIIEATTKKNNIILDTFAGSGATLLACEKSGRINLSIEIDANYVSIILQRWFDTTGIMPELIGGL